MKEPIEIVDKITLNRLKETPNWKDLTDEGLVDFIREVLIRFDIHLQYLGVEYDQLQKIGKWDPDANYTPCEHQMHVMARLFGIDYTKEINDEAYSRIQQWETHLEEVRRRMKE